MSQVKNQNKQTKPKQTKQKTKKHAKSKNRIGTTPSW